MSSIGKLMKQAARMQQQMEQVQAQLAARTVEATSGGGAVKVVAKCDGTLASIKIDPQALNPSDAQLLEDMIVTAANQALGQAKDISNAEMGKVTAGLNLPGFWVNEEGRRPSAGIIFRAGRADFISAFFIPPSALIMLPDSITALIAALSKLPGIGPRSAERIALHLVQADPAAVKQLAETILIAREKIRFCDICGALTEKSPCPICTDARRDASLVCVVERAVDIFSIEKSGTFRGKFHVLGGKISPLDGVEPEDLRIAELEKRLSTSPSRKSSSRWARTWKATPPAITWPSGWRARD